MGMPTSPDQMERSLGEAKRQPAREPWQQEHERQCPWLPDTSRYKSDDFSEGEPLSPAWTKSKSVCPTPPDTGVASYVDSRRGKEPWLDLRDDMLDIDDRADALYACMLGDPERAASFVVEELGRDDVGPQWRDALVFAAEDMQFYDSDERGMLAERLREVARSLRNSVEPDIEFVVWSALRRYVSLVGPTAAPGLQEFLEPRGCVDTRLAALQCVANCFEPAPPADPASLAGLTERMAELAEKFLDPDIFVAGEKAAIALNAIHALASIGDARVPDLLSRARGLNRPWLFRQIGLKLRRTLESWEAASLDSHPLFAELKAQIAALR